MASVRCSAVQSRPTEFVDVTRVTRDEFQPLVPPFATAFHAPLAAGRRDGTPRTARQGAVDNNCPRPTPADRRCCRLVSRTTSALQGVQGRLCGMGQSTAHPWGHVRRPALRAAWRARGAAPARSLPALAQRCGVAAADAATVGTPRVEAPTPGGAVPAAAPAPPLVPMTERRSVRPHDAAAQTGGESGKQKDHPVHKVLLVHVPRTSLCRSATQGGRVHELRLAEATPSALPAGSP